MSSADLLAEFLATDNDQDANSIMDNLLNNDDDVSDIPTPTTPVIRRKGPRKRSIVDFPESPTPPEPYKASSSPLAASGGGGPSTPSPSSSAGGSTQARLVADAEDEASNRRDSVDSYTRIQNLVADLGTEGDEDVDALNDAAFLSNSPRDKPREAYNPFVAMASAGGVDDDDDDYEVNGAGRADSPPIPSVPDEEDNTPERAQYNPFAARLKGSEGKGTMTPRLPAEDEDDDEPPPALPPRPATVNLNGTGASMTIMHKTWDDDEDGGGEGGDDDAFPDDYFPANSASPAHTAREAEYDSGVIDDGEELELDIDDSESDTSAVVTPKGKAPVGANTPQDTWRANHSPTKGAIEGLHHLQEETIQLREENAALKSRLSERDAVLAGLHKKLEMLENENEALQAAAKRAEEEAIKSAGASAEQLEDQVSYVTSQLLDALSKVSDLEGKLEAESEGRRAEADEYKGKIGELEAQLNDADAKLMESALKLQSALDAKSQGGDNSAALQKALTRVSELEKGKAEDQRRVVALVARVKDDKRKLEVAYKQYNDLVVQIKKAQRAIQQLKEKLAKYKAEKGEAVEQSIILGAKLETAAESAERTEKKLRMAKKFLKQADEDYDELDSYCDRLSEKNRLLLRRLASMYNRVKEETSLAKAVFGNVTYEELHTRLPNFIGVLQKRDGSTIKSWKNRFIIIKDNFMLYYKSQSGEPSGVVRLDGATVEVSDDPLKFPHAFRIIPRGGKSKSERVFRAKDDEDLARWLEWMEVASQFFTPGVQREDGRADAGDNNNTVEGVPFLPGQKKRRMHDVDAAKLEPAKRPYGLAEDADSSAFTRCAAV